MSVDLTHEFPLREGLIHLNHAAVSPWPRRCIEAVRRFAEENMQQGSLDYPRWLETEQQLREQFQALLNAPSADDIALVKNTSEALSFVAGGLDWRAGDNVVISDQEFPSNRIVWEALAEQGVELRQARLDAAPSPEAALIAQTDERTRLLAVSSVQFASGLRLDLEALGRHCRSAEILFCVDAIQSLGALQMDVQAIQADFVAADGHKWMLGPEGLGVFYCQPRLREHLRLHEYGWHMVEEMGEFDRQSWSPAHTMRRFECGSPNMLGIHALHASLSLLLEVGMAEVERRVTANARYLLDGLGRHPEIELLTPAEAGRHAGIVTFRHRRQGAEPLHRRLGEAGIFCAQRHGGIRLSPHFYTPQTHLQTALDRVLE